MADLTWDIDRSHPGWLNLPGSVSPARGAIEGLADIEAIEALDPADVMPAATAYDCLALTARATPDKPAIIALSEGGGSISSTITYGDYLRDATAAANLFRSIAGEGPSVVALMLPIVPEALIAAWGATAAGVAMPINPHLEPALVASILKTVNATVLVTTRAFGASAADRLEDIVAQVPSLRRILLVGDDARGGAQEFAAALREHDGDALGFEPSRDPSALAMYLPTGGTTAAPKLARLKHRGMVMAGWIGGAFMGAREDEVIGLGMPLFHVGGMLMLGLRSVVLGQTVLLLSPTGFRDRGIVANFWDIARRFRMTSVMATPTTAATIYASPEDHDGHSIRTFTCGGSTVPLELGNAFRARFGIELREVWGATEFHGFLGCQPNGPPPLTGSVGLRTPWHDVKAVELDEDNRFVREMPPGEQGIIVGAGPCLADGYADRKFDAGFFVKDGPDGRIWGSSGDLGRVNAEGYIWIDGRAKDVIIRGGHNIDPTMIEEALNSAPGVLLAAAVGYPDASKGELPVAYVQLRPDAVLAAEELLEHCRARIPERAACPVAIFLVEVMPLTAVSKIFKPALREMAIIHAATNAAVVATGIAPVDVTIVKDGGRPHVRVTLHSSASAAMVRAALSGFGFASTIHVSDQVGV